MIPKTIHYCWFSGEKYPPKIKECIRSWKRILPDYKLRIWDASSFDFQSIPYLKKCFEMRRWAYVADYIRLYALYNEGGIYLDSDVLVLKSFDSLLDCNAFWGIDAMDEHDYAFPEAAVFGAIKGFSVINEMMDYYHNILPWLKETVLPNCRVREEWLETAIKQYIDHLEGLFDIRDSRKGFRKKVLSKIANRIGCTKEMSRGEVYAELNAFLHTLGELQNIVSNSMESMIKPVIERLQNTTLEVLDDLCPEEEIGFYNGIHNGFFQVFFKKWTTQVHFEWIPINEKRLLSGTEYTLVLHVEQNDIQEHFNQVLCDKQCPALFRVNIQYPPEQWFVFAISFLWIMTKLVLVAFMQDKVSLACGRFRNRLFSICDCTFA